MKKAWRGGVNVRKESDCVAVDEEEPDEEVEGAGGW